MISAALSNPKHSGMERLGDYLMLYLITKNVNPLIIKDVFEKIALPSYKFDGKFDGNDDELTPLQKSSAPELPSSD